MLDEASMSEREKAWRYSHRVVIQTETLGAACGIEPGFYGVAVPPGHPAVTCPDCRTIDELGEQS